jgi:hypothetical protein
VRFQVSDAVDLDHAVIYFSGGDKHASNSSISRSDGRQAESASVPMECQATVSTVPASSSANRSILLASGSNSIVSREIREAPIQVAATRFTAYANIGTLELALLVENDAELLLEAHPAQQPVDGLAAGDAILVGIAAAIGSRHQMLDARLRGG